MMTLHAAQLGANAVIAFRYDANELMNGVTRSPRLRNRRRRRTHERVTDYPRASKTILNGVSAALRKCVNPPLRITFSNLAGPACAPSPRPTSCANEHGTHTVAEAE